MRSNKHFGRHAKFAFTCAKCAEANELTVELGERRAWQAECHGCAALNEVKITVAEAADRLCAARGDPEWTAPPEEDADGEASDGALEEVAAAAEPPKKRPKKAAPEEASTKPVVLKAGTAVIAKFHDGYYYTGIVEDMEAQTRFLIAWDDGDPASWVTARHTCLVYRQPLLSELQPGMPVLAQYSGTLRVDGDREEFDDTWFPAKVVAVNKGAGAEPVDLKWQVPRRRRRRHRRPPARPPPLPRARTRARRRALSACAPARGHPPVAQEGGESFRSSTAELRPFLSFVPAKIAKKPSDGDAQRHRWPASPAAATGTSSGAEPAGQAANRSPEGVAADLIRRSSRDVKEKGDPADATLLRDAIAELRRCWAGSEPRGDWRLTADAGGVPGLTVCTNFLDDQEARAAAAAPPRRRRHAAAATARPSAAPQVEALRSVVGAHRTWTQYTWGSVGHDKLASVVQRIDFGPQASGQRPEGFTGGRSDAGRARTREGAQAPRSAASPRSVDPPPSHPPLTATGRRCGSSARRAPNFSRCCRTACAPSSRRRSCGRRPSPTRSKS